MAQVLTINGGSSSIKFALFATGDFLRRVLDGRIKQIGQSDATFSVNSVIARGSFSHGVKGPDHTAAVGALMDWIKNRGAGAAS